jgi:hypothetical protein
MKRLLLISFSALCLSGCIYTNPYGYSRYNTVTPIYHPQPYYVPVPPPPRYRYFERSEHRSYSRPHHHNYW